MVNYTVAWPPTMGLYFEDKMQFLKLAIKSRLIFLPQVQNELSSEMNQTILRTEVVSQHV